jgi:hypothetical protein
MSVLCISFFDELLRSIRKTKYTKRFSAKSSTIYKEQIIKRGRKKKKRIHLVPKMKLFSQGRNLPAQNFVHFESKRCGYKISVLM